MATKITCAAKTDVGLKRTNNEDNLIMVPSHGLYVLADGMGGHASGQVASTMCVSHVAQFICEISHQPGFEFPYPANKALSYEANLLVNAIKFANERVYIQSCKDRAMEGMGTTVTAILNAPHGLVLAHVGDSRIYRVRKGQITQMSKDHSLLNHLIDKGELKPEDAKNFANKNVILRAIGLKDYVDVDVKEVPREQGDIYMMCSDGLSDIVSDEKICQAITEAPNLTKACDTLIDLALQAGGKDNVTVVCVCVEKEDGIQSQPAPAISRPSVTSPSGAMPMAAPPMAAQIPAGPAAMGARPQPPMTMNRAPGAGVGNGPVSVPSAAHMGMAPMPLGRPAAFAAAQSAPVPAPPAPAKPARMHSVREIVVEVVQPAQRAMPKPIATGRSSAMSMPAVPLGKPAAQPASPDDSNPPVKENSAPESRIAGIPGPENARKELSVPPIKPVSHENIASVAKAPAIPVKDKLNDSKPPFASESDFKPQTPTLAGLIQTKPRPVQPETAETEDDEPERKTFPSLPTAPQTELKQVGRVSEEDRKELPETNLLFMTPPTSATASTDDMSALDEEPESSHPNYAIDNERTVLECPIVTDDMLAHHFPEEDEDEDPDKTVSLEREDLGSFASAPGAPAFVKPHPMATIPCAPPISATPNPPVSAIPGKPPVSATPGSPSGQSHPPVSPSLPAARQTVPPPKQTLPPSRSNLPPAAASAPIMPAPPKQAPAFFGNAPTPDAPKGSSQIMSAEAVNAAAEAVNAAPKGYVAPVNVVRPPRHYSDDDDDSIEIGGIQEDDDDSIEIAYDSDDDEDDVTRRFIRPPQFKKW